MTRKKTEAEVLATDEHGKTRNKTKAETRKRSRRKDWISCLPLRLCGENVFMLTNGVIIRGHSIIALKGLNEIAQGNALGMCAKKSQALKGRKVLLIDHCALSGLV
jgi:hypothetical protein